MPSRKRYQLGADACERRRRTFTTRAGRVVSFEHQFGKDCPPKATRAPTPAQERARAAFAAAAQRCKEKVREVRNTCVRERLVTVPMPERMAPDKGSNSARGLAWEIKARLVAQRHPRVRFETRAGTEEADPRFAGRSSFVEVEATSEAGARLVAFRIAAVNRDWIEGLAPFSPFRLVATQRFGGPGLPSERDRMGDAAMLTEFVVNWFERHRAEIAEAARGRSVTADVLSEEVYRAFPRPAGGRWGFDSVAVSLASDIQAVEVDVTDLSLAGGPRALRLHLVPTGDGWTAAAVESAPGLPPFPAFSTTGEQMPRRLAEALVRFLDGAVPAATIPEAAPSAGPSDAPRATFYRDRATRRAWLEFAVRQPDSVTDLLRRAGWRWSGYRKMWHRPGAFTRPPAGIVFDDGGEVSFSEERAERLEARSEKAAAEASARFGAAHRVASVIPMGQPILVGHHSEKRHRRDIERIHRNMDKGIEAQRESERLERASEASARHVARATGDVGLIMRRIKKLEADERAVLARWERSGQTPSGEAAEALQHLREEIEYNQGLLQDAGGEAAIPVAAPGDLINGRNIVYQVNKTTYTVFDFDERINFPWNLKLDKSKVSSVTKATPETLAKLAARKLQQKNRK